MPNNDDVLLGAKTQTQPTEENLNPQSHVPLTIDFNNSTALGCTEILVVFTKRAIRLLYHLLWVRAKTPGRICDDEELERILGNTKTVRNAVSEARGTLSKACGHTMKIIYESKAFGTSGYKVETYGYCKIISPLQTGPLRRNDEAK